MRALRLLGRLAVWLVGLALLAVLVVQLWYLGWIAFWKWENPAETAFMARERARLQARAPQADLRHQWVPYARIAPSLKRAVVTAEDARFAEHDGVDWDAIQKAYQDNLRRGRPARGGSTISQQLAKNLFLSAERSYVRKAQELVITTMLEALWDKQRILEVYLNVVEWGDGVFGAEAAARRYFKHPAAKLVPHEAALLAAMLPSPLRSNPLNPSEYLRKRQRWILRQI